MPSAKQAKASEKKKIENEDEAGSLRETSRKKPHRISRLPRSMLRVLQVSATQEWCSVFRLGQTSF